MLNELKLREFHIISGIEYPSGCNIGQVINIIVSSDTCKFYPNELSELQEYLRGVKYQWTLTLTV